MQTRIYRPMSLDELRRLGRDGMLEPAPFSAYAVTADLRREHPAADEEELEYLAFGDAAGPDVSAPARLIAAADVDETEVTELLTPGRAVSEVRVSVPVPRRHVVSFHVADERPAGAEGSAEYSWYDATEIDAVVDLLS